jgi:hypothetical protein
LPHASLRLPLPQSEPTHGRTCSATQGTAFYRLRTSAETVRLVVTLLAHGCPRQATAVALGSDERTVAGWAAHRPLLVCPDGLVSSIRAMRETLRDPIHTGTGGRPRLRPWRHVLIV